MVPQRDKAEKGARAERHRVVTRLYDAGVCLSEIAHVTGYSRSRVRRIIDEYLVREWVLLRRVFDDVDEVEVVMEVDGTREFPSVIGCYL